MQAYNPSFARIYNMRWNGFANQTAPRLRECFEGTPLGQVNRHMLDLCCGAGHLALHFLDQGYFVTGLDLSDAMLRYARENTAPYVITGQIRFVQGDAAHFSLDERFGLVVSTFDALNHLPDWPSLVSCFECVSAHLEEGGMFIFDLNTRHALSRWTGISLEDTPEMMLVIRSLYDEASERAFMRVSGFVAVEDGRYERFEETAYEMAFDMQAIHSALLKCGFKSVRFTRGHDLHTPVTDPERESRIFIVAEK